MLTHISWRARDVVFTMLLISLLSLGIGIVDELVLTDLQLPFLTMFDLIGSSVIVLVLIYKYKLNVRALYGFRYIGIAPLCVILSLLVLVARIVIATGWTDIQWLIQTTPQLVSFEFFQFVLTRATSLLLAPVWEEFLFRGALFVVILRKFGVLPAYVVSSLLFAFLHLDVNVFYGYEYVVGSVLIMLFVDSIIKAYVVYHAQSLTIPTLMHIASNGAALAVEFLYLQMGYRG